MTLLNEDGAQRAEQMNALMNKMIEEGLRPFEIKRRILGKGVELSRQLVPYALPVESLRIAADGTGYVQIYEDHVIAVLAWRDVAWIKEGS